MWAQSQDISPCLWFPGKKRCRPPSISVQPTLFKSHLLHSERSSLTPGFILRYRVSYALNFLLTCKVAHAILQICSIWSICCYLWEENIMDGSSEKVSVNMNVGTLSQIDLLVDLGYYSNRSDFINQSVRQSLDQKQSIIENEASRQRESNGDWFTGIYVVTKDQLVNAKERGKKVKISGYGVVVIDKKLDDLALEVIESIDIKGKILASQKTKEHFQGVPRNELT